MNWLKIRKRFKGGPSKSSGEARYKCKCGRSVRYVAKINNEMVCEKCYKEATK